MKKVIVIGGGTGQSYMLRAIKNIDKIDLKTIVTVADDGGSTGRLRDIFNIPAVGDIRSVMIALSENENLLSRLMNYRFKNDSAELSGHNLGNLILVAMIDNSDSFLDAVYQMSHFLKIKGEIIPATSFSTMLSALMSDGKIVDGEHNITAAGGKVQKVFYRHKVYANTMAIQAILDADYIIYSIGSLYTSILPILIIPDIHDALSNSKAKKIYFCNAMTEYGETTDYSLEDHVKALVEHTGCRVDVVVGSSDVIPENILELYKEEKAGPVIAQEINHDFELIQTELLSFKNNLIRHDVDKINKILKELLI